MAMAISMKHYLDEQHIDYELISHGYSQFSLQSAEHSHIHGDQVAKCVMLEDGKGYLIAVLPSTRKIEFSRLEQLTQRHLALATEQELAATFQDCAQGAVPPLGSIYHLPVVCDDAINDCEDVYFEAGDHKKLVHIKGGDFRHLMSQAQHGSFSRHI